MDFIMDLIQDFLQQTLIYQIMLVTIVVLGLLASYLNIKRQEANFEIKRLKANIKQHQYLLALPDSQPSNHQMKPKIPTADKTVTNKSNPVALGNLSSLKVSAIYGCINNSMAKVAIPDIPAKIHLFTRGIIGGLKTQCQSIKRRTDF